MAIRVRDALQKVSNSWVTLLALLLFVLFTGLVLPRQAQQAEDQLGAAGSPDTAFFYTAGDLYRLAEAYGEQGRQAYIRARFTFDLVWPLVYAFFLATAISWIFGHAFQPNSGLHYANLAPVLGLLFDYAENLSSSLVMGRYPEQTPFVDWLAPIFTLLKWVFVYGSFLFLLLGITVLIWKRWQNKRA